MKTLQSLVCVASLMIAASGLEASWTELEKINAYDGYMYDMYGGSVEMDGNYSFIGALGEDSAAKGAGAVYVYLKDSGSWNITQKLTASDAQIQDRFGISAAISGANAIVGADKEDSNGYNAGAAYIFNVDENGTWNEVQKLIASDGKACDFFGENVAISDEYAVVGAKWEDNASWKAGAAYIFQVDVNGTWNEVQKLIASDAKAGDYFGNSVAIEGDFIIVGADEVDDKGSNAGAAYVFQVDVNGTWNEVQKIYGSDTEKCDHFGYSVAMDGNFSVIGANRESAGGYFAGAAYIFQVDENGTWNEVQKLAASDAQACDFFGTSLDISGTSIITGAYKEDTVSWSAGAAYVFQMDENGTWNETEKLMASDGEACDYFGFSVGISEQDAVVGAPFENTNGKFSGAAYFFDEL